MTQADAAFLDQLGRPSGSEPGFVAALRASARETFAREKLPTTRHEDWRYTNLAALSAEPNIEWIFGKAGRILVEHGRIAGLAMEDGDAYRCRALVVTTGTFLNGLIHIGPEQHPAGRAGEPPSRELAWSLKSHGFVHGRLKTGTPPRLDRRAIIQPVCGLLEANRSAPRERPSLLSLRAPSPPR